MVYVSVFSFGSNHDSSPGLVVFRERASICTLYTSLNLEEKREPYCLRQNGYGKTDEVPASVFLELGFVILGDRKNKRALPLSRTRTTKNKTGTKDVILRVWHNAGTVAESPFSQARVQ